MKYWIVDTDVYVSQGHLVSGHPFMSRTAKEFARPYRGDKAAKKNKQLKKRRVSEIHYSVFDLYLNQQNQLSFILCIV